MPGSRVHATLPQASPDYTVQLRARQHALAADEPMPAGGADAGFRPFELALAGLVSCTAITLRMYAARKGWVLGDVQVDAQIRQDGEAYAIDRTVTLSGALTDEQRQRLREICEKTPVTLFMKRGASVVTQVVGKAE